MPERYGALLRVAVRYLASDAHDDPDGGLPAVLDWRAEIHHRTNLDTWATGGGQIWDLPPAGSGLPAQPRTEPVPTCSATLTHLVRGLQRSGRPAVLRVAAGEPDALSPIDLFVYPQAVIATANGEALTYAPWSLAGCPTVDVPLYRIIAVSDPR